MNIAFTSATRSTVSDDSQLPTKRNLTTRLLKFITASLALVATVLVITGSAPSRILSLLGFDRQIERHADDMLDEGRETFRFDTFGDEAFWGDTLKLHQAIEGSRFGGVGDGLSPKAALGLGLKVDVTAVPPGVVRQM